MVKKWYLSFAESEKTPPKDGKGIYYMSKPIFSEDGRIAILYVSIIWAPLFGRGYVELYELQEDGTWKMTAQHNTWMSWLFTSISKPITQTFSSEFKISSVRIGAG